MRLWHIGLILVLMVGVLAGCGGGSASSADDAPAAAENPPVEEQETIVQTGSESDDSDTGVVPDASDELPLGNRLVLGTFMLEGTENAVTPAQAKTLLPLWQAIQGGSLQGQTETDAVLKQIEGAMTAGQLAAIDAMQLTGEDMGTWMLEQGVNFRPPRGAEGGEGGFGGLGDMTEEERAEMRATRQAGGGFADMSEEEREAKRATAEAGGFGGGGRLGSAGRGQGQLTFLATPLVELLTARAAE